MFSKYGDEHSDDIAIKKALIQRVVGISLFITTIILAVVIIYLATKTADTHICQHSNSDYMKPRDLNNPEVFDDLTPDEYEVVNSFMLRNKEIGIKQFDSATINSSYIFMIDLFLPNKDETIQYLDTDSKKPAREAMVTVVRGDKDPPVVEEYIVSPAPQPIQLRLYKNPSYRHDPIPYTSRPIDNVDYKFLFRVVVNKLTEELYPLLMQSYGLCYHNCTKGINCLTICDFAQRGNNNGDRKSWQSVFPDVDGFYIHPLGLEFLIDHNSTDTSQWRVEQIVYNGQQFENASALMTSYSDKSLRLVNIHSSTYQSNPLYSSYESRGDLPDKPIQGPKLIEPEGKRYQVHGQLVMYNKWSFRYHMGASTGLQLFDVKFDGTRIAYEISLQEVLVLYSSYVQGPASYYHASRLIGASSMELVSGVDCPDTAIYLDTYMFANAGSTKRFKNNICVFENNGGIPMRRHYANNFEDGYRFYGGISDYHLVVRTIASIRSNDYIIDYIFYNNGAVEAKVSATGYVQAIYKLAEEEQYGSTIHEHVIADLYVHMFNYKVDVDIAGTSNRYTVFDIGLETIEQPWNPGLNKTQLKMNSTLIHAESNESTYKWTTPQYHMIHNKNARSQYGLDRGYRILNKSPVPHLLSGQPITAAASWANYPIVVTKRKDSERYSSSIYAQNNPWNPMVDFDDFIDGDNITDEDIVAWVTIGTHHIPGTEDIPSTPTTWNQYSFYLTPHNYFSECPSVNSADTVLIRPSREKTRKPMFATYGRSFETTCIPRSTGPFNYDGIRR